MTQATKLQLPIGYWLKQADNLLTEQIDHAQAVHGVSRAEWQVLNLLMEHGHANHEAIFATMRTFVDEATLDAIFASLLARGWVELQEAATPRTDIFQLTAEGQRQHAVIFATQKEVRQRAMQGISAEEYATVVRVLQQMVSNLGG
jgi:DNA-binding MarR family transcriptional regulator